MTTNVVCTKCAAQIHPLEVFPGSICLPCHAKETEHMTDQELHDIIVKTFGGKS